MALPDGFSSWEHLQDVLRKYHNKLVREEFSDITDDDAIAIPRGALKRACLLDDDDTVDMTLLRLHLFFFHARKAADLQAPIYGIPISAYDETVIYHPSVTLYFAEDEDQVTLGKQPVRAEISFRLINETSATFTESEARNLAQKIKTEFGGAGGYRWRKGKLLVTYKRPDQGVYFQIYAFSETEAREVIEKVLNIKNYSFDSDYLVLHESKANFPANPGTHLIYGKVRPKIVRRPVTYVRFKRASVQMHGLTKGILLYDCTGYRQGLVGYR
jgi:hypothetical protein